MTQDLTIKESSGSQFIAMLEKNKIQIQRALPKHVSVERIIRIAQTEASLNPELLACDLRSFLGAVIQCAQLGLEPGKTLGQIYLIPFNNFKKNTKEVSVMLGYQGMLQLIGNSIDSPVLIPRVVLDGDEFEYSLGLNPVLKHVPLQPPNDNAKLIYAYAVATFRDKRKEFSVMTRHEIERIRMKAQSQKVWGPFYNQMAMKTVIRNLYKFMPKSVELQRAINLDELHEAHESQSNESVIETEKLPLHKAERLEKKMSDDPEEFDNFK